MAEGFANHYGSDVLIAASAGLAPAQAIPPDTVNAMAEMNIDMSQHVPQRYDPFAVANYDIIVNMAGFKLPGPAPNELLEWQVRDPIGCPAPVYRVVRDDLEQRVMRLILDLRKRAKQ
jgi:arsenate reductase (thioredoxin)